MNIEIGGKSGASSFLQETARRAVASKYGWASYFGFGKKRNQSFVYFLAGTPTKQFETDVGHLNTEIICHKKTHETCRFLGAHGSDDIFFPKLRVRLPGWSYPHLS